jgi:predicted transcriptional regulator
MSAKNVTIRVDEHALYQLQGLAKVLQMSMSSVIRAAITQYLDGMRSRDDLKERVQDALRREAEQLGALLGVDAETLSNEPAA